jgi:hypothetical protein
VRAECRNDAERREDARGEECGSVTGGVVGGWGRGGEDDGVERDADRAAEQVVRAFEDPEREALVVGLDVGDRRPPAGGRPACAAARRYSPSSPA